MQAAIIRTLQCDCDDIRQALAAHPEITLRLHKEEEVEQHTDEEMVWQAAALHQQYFAALPRSCFWDLITDDPGLRTTLAGSALTPKEYIKWVANSRRVERLTHHAWTIIVKDGAGAWVQTLQRKLARRQRHPEQVWSFILELPAHDNLHSTHWLGFRLSGDWRSWSLTALFTFGIKVTAVLLTGITLAREFRTGYARGVAVHDSVRDAVSGAPCTYTRMGEGASGTSYREQCAPALFRETSDVVVKGSDGREFQMYRDAGRLCERLTPLTLGPLACAYSRSEGTGLIIVPPYDGGDLDQLCKSSSLVSEQFASIATQMAQGVDELWRRDISHGDIKPANFFTRMVEGHIQVFLGDLGSACRITQASAYPCRGHGEGTSRFEHIAYKDASVAYTCFDPALSRTEMHQELDAWSLLVSWEYMLRFQPTAFERESRDGWWANVYPGLEAFQVDLRAFIEEYTRNMRQWLRNPAFRIRAELHAALPDWLQRLNTLDDGLQTGNAFNEA
jgi:hypothetical protein